MIIEDILMYYKTGEIGTQKVEPKWIDEKEAILEKAFHMDEMKLEQYDYYSGLIANLTDAHELWGFMLGIRFAFEMIQETENKI